jgi:hypothetical protein
MTWDPVRGGGCEAAEDEPENGRKEDQEDFFRPR